MDSATVIQPQVHPDDVDTEPAGPTPGAWPHTRRPMPWLVALFVAMIYLFPVDSTMLPIHLPVNSGVDRFVLGILFLVWLVLSLAGRVPPRFKHTPINGAVYAFIGLCIVSVVSNVRALAWNGELDLSIKQLSLTLTFIGFFYIAASSLERRDLVPFCKLLVGLGALSALGTILEYRGGTDIFADLARAIPGASVRVPAAAATPGARVLTAGPTLHGLADATLLDTAVPFAMTFLVTARDKASRWRWGIALILLIAGCVATQEKTALILLLISILVTVLYMPRRFARYWPLLIVAVIAIRFAAPHAISGLRYQFRVIGSSNSTTGRSSDYSAVAPFIATHLLVGRGYGSFDPHKYRILDNQLLGYVIDIGVIGTISYAAMILSPVFSVHRTARRPRTPGELMMVPVAAGCITYLLSNLLYDTVSFRQGPYVFFFLAALAAVQCGYTGATAPPLADPT